MSHITSAGRQIQNQAGPGTDYAVCADKENSEAIEFICWESKLGLPCSIRPGIF